MSDLTSMAIAIIYSASLIIGSGYGLKTIHDEVRKAALTKASKNLKSSEQMSNQLTGESTPF